MEKYTAYIIEPARQNKAGSYTSAGSDVVKAMSIENLRKNLMAKYKGQYDAIHVIRLLSNGMKGPEEYMMLMALPDSYWSMRRFNKGRTVIKTWVLNTDGTLGRRI